MKLKTFAAFTAVFTLFSLNAFSQGRPGSGTDQRLDRMEDKIDQMDRKLDRMSSTLDRLERLLRNGSGNDRPGRRVMGSTCTITASTGSGKAYFGDAPTSVEAKSIAVNQCIQSEVFSSRCNLNSLRCEDRLWNEEIPENETQVCSTHANTGSGKFYTAKSVSKIRAETESLNECIQTEVFSSRCNKTPTCESVYDR